MKTRHLIVTDKITPLPERLKDKATHSIDVSDAKYKNTGFASYWILDNGAPRIKTAAELKAQQADIDKESKRKAAKATRDTALQALTIELDGNVFQARPQDEVNFRLSIATIDGSEEWVLENNTVVAVSKADLEKVYSQGLAASKAIYQVYKEALKAL